MFISKGFNVFFICLLALCEISKAQTSNLPKQLKEEKIELSLTMKRMACFDGCQVYNLEIQPNGKIVFEGIQLTKIKGKIKSSLSKEKMNQLVNEINTSDFFALKDFYIRSENSCPMVATDNPTVMLSVKLDGKEKTITHYLGCRENFKLGESWKIFPQPLYKLENKIDEIVETNRWIGEIK